MCHAHLYRAYSIVSLYTAVTDTCPPLSRSPDFLSFWQDTLAELQDIPASIEAKAEQQTDDGLLLQRVKYRSLNNVVIEGYLLAPKESVSGDKPSPLIVYTHGYMSQCEVIRPWAKQGAMVFGMDIRGFGRSQNAAPQLSEHGYVLTGIESPHTSILRGAVCDFIRGVEVAHELLKNQQRNTVLYGKSFGGALAAMTAGLTQYGDFLVVAVPTFSWMEGRRKLVSEGSGAEINTYIQQHPDQEQNIMDVLSYFDTMNFAPLIQCPAMVGVGRQDTVVPAETVYAFINHLKVENEVREYPVSHTSLPEEILWDSYEEEWLARVMAGTFSL
jgi:cephalosporin-C deacetylase